VRSCGSHGDRRARDRPRHPLHRASDPRTSGLMLQAYVAGQAEARPDSIAVVMGEERLSYAELDAASNRLARALQDAGLRRGDRVCLLLSKSPRAIIAMLAVLKAGGAYVPVDVTGPAQRTERILRAAEPTAIIVTSSSSALLDELVRLGCVTSD